MEDIFVRSIFFLILGTKEILGKGNPKKLSLSNYLKMQMCV